VGDESVDMIWAFSVFSHMLSDDTTTYLAEFRRALAPHGKALITVFMADGVPNETENPTWYGNWSGRLHCVLYSTDYIERLISEAGFILERVIKREGRKQDSLLLGPR
jgi:cyclopropane fatty-acyl-phospholipid synthase-like methyltransferase